MQPPTKTKGVENTPRPLHTQCFLWPLSRTVIIAATVRLSESLVLCFVSHLPFVCRVRVPEPIVLWFAPLECCASRLEVAVPSPSPRFRLSVGCQVPMANVLWFAPLGVLSSRLKVAVPLPSSRFRLSVGLSGPEGECSVVCSFGVLCFTT